MSDTTVFGVAAGVAAYVREVRAELADLPTEDVDDLTGGMEADLSELAAECGGDLAGRLGSPRLYAAELRAAAGLMERDAGSAPRRRPLGDAVDHARSRFTLATEQRPWLRSVMAFLVTIRPAWWVLRGYLAAWVVWNILGINGGMRPQGITGALVALMAVVVSVQLGRGWLRQFAMTPPLLAVGNAIAVVVMLIAATAGVSSGQASYGETASPAPGLSLNGEPVGNIYAYDSDGKRITGVRLFDQNGRPMDADPNWVDANGRPADVDASGSQREAVRDSSRAPVMNSYPRALVGSDPWQVTDPDNPQPDPPVWVPPVAIVPLATRGMVAVPTPTPTLTPTAAGPASKATSEPGPSKSASPAPTVSR